MNLFSDKNINNLSAERAVIIALITDWQRVDFVLTELKEDDFYFRENQVIYSQIKHLINNKMSVSWHHILDTLSRKEDALNIKDALADYAETMPATSQVEEYVSLIKYYSRLRQVKKNLISLIEKINQSPESGADIDVVWDEVDREIDQVTQSENLTQHKLESVIDVFTEEIIHNKNKKEYLSGLSTGYYPLDIMTGGLQRGNVIVVGAKPSVGKSAFALNIVYNVIKRGGSVLFFSFEMSKQLLMLRLLGIDTLIRTYDIQSGDLTPTETTLIKSSLNRMKKWKLFIDDSNNKTVNEIREKSRKVKREHGLDLVVVDYLQLINTKKDYKTTREREIAETTRLLKCLATEVESPIIELSQLNRRVEEISGKKPTMDNLRESGAIEQDADLILLLHKELIYKEYGGKQDSVLEVIVEKQRMGETGSVYCYFDEICSKISNLSVEYKNERFQ